jgi:hypothetical protein
VHAAETTGREEPDAGQVRQVRGRRHRRRAGKSLAEHRTEIANTGLDHFGAFGDPHQRVAIEPDTHLAIENAQRGGHCSLASYGVLDASRGVGTRRCREAVTDDRGLQCHDRTARCNSVGHLVVADEQRTGRCHERHCARPAR